MGKTEIRSRSYALMQTTNVGLTSHGSSARMMNEGRHHHPQPHQQRSFKNCSNTSQHCCCFSGGKESRNKAKGTLAPERGWKYHIILRRVLQGPSPRATPRCSQPGPFPRVLPRSNPYHPWGLTIGSRGFYYGNGDPFENCPLSLPSSPTWSC